MITQILDTASYSLNVFAVPTFVTAVAVLVLGIYSVVHERFSFVSILLFLMSFSAFEWFFSFSLMYCARGEEVALWWGKAAYLSLPLLPSLIYHFTVVILRIFERSKKLLRVSWFFSIVFVSLALGTDLLIRGVYRYWWGYYPRYDILSIPYLTFFFGMMFISFRHYWIEYGKAIPGTMHQRRIKVFLVSFSITSLSLLDYVAKYGIALYPVGYLPILIFLVMLSVAISRYSLVDITPAFAAKKITDTMTDALFVLDEEGVIRLVNGAATELFGYSEEELIGRHVSKLIDRELCPEMEMRKDMKTMTSRELPYLRGDQEYILSLSASVMKDRREQPVAVVCIARDITRRKRSEEELRKYRERLEDLVETRTSQLQAANEQLQQKIAEQKMTAAVLMESEERYRNIFEDSREAIFITDQDGRVMNVNQSALDLFGYSVDDMRKYNVLLVYAEAPDRKKFQREIEQNGFVRNYEIRLRKKNGIEINCLMSATVRRDANGSTIGYQGIIRDVTEHKKEAEHLRYLGMHDPLTGLYNRAYFEEEMRRLEGGRENPIGIIVCDVDGLKLINDALGHYHGDQLIVSTANILKKSFREGDVVARIGGDEFAVLLPNSDIGVLETACKRIRDAIADYALSKPEITLSISMGFAMNDRKHMGIINLFKEADDNMYKEKLHRSPSARGTILKTFMKTLEAKDFIREGHVNRLQRLLSVAEITDLPDHDAGLLKLLAEFHDIGKVGISDSIIFKETKLTDDEWFEMQRHCEIGRRIALYTPVLLPIADLILKHHEWSNGDGYPLGLKGLEIPAECRIFAVADAYEVMTSDRPCRKALSHEEAVGEIRKSISTQFDPDIALKFIRAIEDSGINKEESAITKKTISKTV